MVHTLILLFSSFATDYLKPLLIYSLVIRLSSIGLSVPPNPPNETSGESDHCNDWNNSTAETKCGRQPRLMTTRSNPICFPTPTGPLRRNPAEHPHQHSGPCSELAIHHKKAYPDAVSLLPSLLFSSSVLLSFPDLDSELHSLFLSLESCFY